MSSSSELSELTSNVSSEDEEVLPSANKGKLDHYFKQGGNAATQKPPTLKKKRPPSPPHEYVLADNPDVAFLCMFRSRFSDAFPKSLPHFGPQDIESGVVGMHPGEYVEKLLCTLLGLVLNRKKDIEKGHYTRALEEAIQSHHSEWPQSWEGRNPLHAGGSFNTMTPEQRLTLMKTLVLWSLESSDAVREVIKESYKQSRHDDDLNQPLSVHPWGRDGDKRRFWLIEGRDDTHFRLYRESNPALKTVTWRNLAGTIEELRLEADKLDGEGTQASRRLHDRIMAAIPRFEASEEKRRRRDYRMARRAQFTRPEPGFSLYEGRTRGKRIRYNYSDDEYDEDEAAVRRSDRQSGVSTPAEPAGPTFTASGRQVRPRQQGAYGETLLGGDRDGGDAQAHDAGDEFGAVQDDEDGDVTSRGRSRQRDQTNGVKPGPAPKGRRRSGSESEEEMDDGSNDTSSGNEWQGNDDDGDDEVSSEGDVGDGDAEMEDVEDGTAENSDEEQHSLVVRLHYGKGSSTRTSIQPSSPLPEDSRIGPSSNGETEMLDAASQLANVQSTTPAVNGQAGSSQESSHHDHSNHGNPVEQLSSQPVTAKVQTTMPENSSGPNALPNGLNSNVNGAAEPAAHSVQNMGSPAVRDT